jgi:hypothetical protein
MTMIGNIQPQPSIIATGTQAPIGSISNMANVSSSTPLTKSDSISSSINSGTIPAVKPNLVNRIGNTTANVAKGAVNGTISATREVGNVVKDTLPKPEPLSAKLIGNRFVAALVVGGLVNGIRTTVKVARGEYNQEQAVHAVMKDTALGAISGVSLVGGMGLTASTLGRIMGGVPLSLVALTVGTVASMMVTDLVTQNIDFFSDKPQTA